MTHEVRDASYVSHPISGRLGAALTGRLDMVTDASRLLVLGTSLATYSAFRLVKQAREQGKEVLMISLGPSRADPLPGVEKMERKAGDVLRVFLDEIIK